MNIITEVKEYIIEYTNRKGHYPKHIYLGKIEKKRLKNIPNLMLVGTLPEGEWPNKIFQVPFTYCNEDSCIRIR